MSGFAYESRRWRFDFFWLAVSPHTISIPLARRVSRVRPISTPHFQTYSLRVKLLKTSRPRGERSGWGNWSVSTPHRLFSSFWFVFRQVLQTEVNLHQAEIVAVGVLGHSVQGLIRTPEFERGKTISQRYDELCANISVYQEKLQAALTTSQNFKDGLDVAIKALTELKKQLDKVTPVSRNLIELRNQAQRFKVTRLTEQELMLPENTFAGHNFHSFSIVSKVWRIQFEKPRIHAFSLNSCTHKI